MTENAGAPSLEQVLAHMEQEIGAVPEPMAAFAKIKPSVVMEQARTMRFAAEGSSLPPRCRLLVAIGTAVGTGASACIKTQVMRALRAGVTPEEIADALVMARATVASSSFANAKEALKVLAEAMGESAEG